MYTRKGNFNEAVKFAQKAIKLNPNNICYTHTLATLLAANERWTAALPLVQRFIENANHQNQSNIDDDGIMLFQEIADKGRATEVASLLSDISNKNAYWQGMQHALDTIGSKNPERINAIMADSQHPAHSIFNHLSVNF